jgi:hypothetical protein
MRIVPLLPSSTPPGPWRRFPAAELAWDGLLHPDWNAPMGSAPVVHALHLPEQAWGAQLGETALAALRPRAGADFLVLRAGAPEGRSGLSAFLSTLEGLLEVAQGHALKLALRPHSGSVEILVRHLRDARGEAVGFCWDGGLNPELDLFSDRLFCAVGAPGDDFGPIQRLGYRWNLAVPAQDPERHRQLAARILKEFPPVLFPSTPDLPEAE